MVNSFLQCTSKLKRENKFFLTDYCDRTLALFLPEVVGKPFIFYFQVLVSISLSQIRKLLRCASPQIANPKFFIINPQVANPQNTAQFCLKPVLKVVFVNFKFELEHYLLFYKDKK
jgi:hypothetical protein